MGDLTSNYGLFLPDDNDSMGDVKLNLTDSFEKLASRADPTIIPSGNPLPQAGDFEVGDRVFRNDVINTDPLAYSWPSTYILVCKDSNWGWHWRPVQQVISPWVDVPATAINLTTDWELHPTYKLQIALDSKGWCHWRGAIRKKTPNIPVATSMDIFKVIPRGIRPNVRIMFTCSVTPVVSGTGKAGNVSGRFFCSEVGFNSFRMFNTNNATSQVIWMDGIQYNNSDHYYYNV